MPLQPMMEEMGGVSNTHALGRLVFVDYVYAFEIAGLILLVAIIAAVALTLRRRKDSKSQIIADQVAVNPADRMRMVKMDSEMDAKQDQRGKTGGEPK
jgi:NADH-quinone oxidoreductase subunit J